MNDNTPDRPHPLGLTANPEWQISLTKRADLYLAERARRADPEREPSGVGLPGIVIAGGAAVLIAASLIRGLLS